MDSLLLLCRVDAFLVRGSGMFMHSVRGCARDCADCRLKSRPIPSGSLAGCPDFFTRTTEPDKLPYFHNEIDHIIFNRKYCLTDVSVVPKFYTGSDHRLLRARFRFSRQEEKAVKFKKRSPRTTTNWDLYISLAGLWFGKIPLWTTSKEYDQFVHHLRDSAKGAESLKTTKRQNEDTANSSLLKVITKPSSETAFGCNLNDVTDEEREQALSYHNDLRSQLALGSLDYYEASWGPAANMYQLVRGCSRFPGVHHYVKCFICK
ncbi:unnamed protein product [Heligmosomoides polygyrus]|uniref:Endo/exonuclease/phosphatase domain-containing protein n=1 Tax=Heligmosomoides polygyrus TaxID=6339 RepID=A0A3P8A232_HELPZ|nr:unnamed protein product [Heligmosomoides polygyrus]